VDRQSWIDQRRAAVLAAYDAEAAAYDQNPYPNDVQREWVRRLLQTCPIGGIVLDAPCGTGYFPMVADAGHRVVGIDQSGGMLSRPAPAASRSSSSRSACRNSSLWRGSTP
jgi:SAM-dependent methyltransferase